MKNKATDLQIMFIGREMSHNAKLVLTFPKNNCELVLLHPVLTLKKNNYLVLLGSWKTLKIFTCRSINSEWKIVQDNYQIWNFEWLMKEIEEGYIFLILCVWNIQYYTIYWMTLVYPPKSNGKYVPLPPPNTQDVLAVLFCRVNTV